MGDTSPHPPHHTGDDADGRSSIVEDAPAMAIRTVAERPVTAT